MPIAVRILVLCLVFAAVLLAIEAAANWIRSTRASATAVNKRLRMIEHGRDRDEVLNSLRRTPIDNGTLPAFVASLMRKLGNTLHAAGVHHKPNRILIVMGALLCTLFLLFLGLAVTSGITIIPGVILLIFILSACVGFLVPYLVLKHLAEKRRKKMQAQFPVALDVFVRGLRAGHPVSAALDLLTTEMPDPIGSEFGVAVDEITYGSDMKDALQAMADRWDLPDMQMFVVCLSIQNETGGNLAEILENLSMVIRERASMYMKVRALSSEGRMTSVILTILPILAFVGVFMMNPQFYLDVAGERMFIIGFGGLITLYFIGFFTIRKMVDLKV